METRSRRDFLALVGAGVGAGAAAIALGGCRSAPEEPSREALAPTTPAAPPTAPGAIPMRPLGKTGLMVSALCLGGYHIGQAKSEAEGIRIIHEAIDGGVNFLDNAWEYNDGRSEEWMGKALAEGGRRDKVVLMTKVCSHGRGEAVAMQQLEQSLRRLRTDHIDLWQLHEVIYDNDPDLHFAAEGAASALEKAKKQGKVRFIGFTGHKDPSIHKKMLAQNFPFDACQMPLNCFDATFRSFEREVLPEVQRRGIAAIGMKSLSGGGDSVKKGVITAVEGLRYAMSLPVATTVSGIDSLDVLRQNLAVAKGFKPMTPAEMDALRMRVAKFAADGRFELYKTSKKYDGAPGREQHGFPPKDELGG